MSSRDQCHEMQTRIFPVAKKRLLVWLPEHVFSVCDVNISELSLRIVCTCCKDVSIILFHTAWLIFYNVAKMSILLSKNWILLLRITNVSFYNTCYITSANTHVYTLCYGIHLEPCGVYELTLQIFLYKKICTLFNKLTFCSHNFSFIHSDTWYVVWQERLA